MENFIFLATILGAIWLWKAQKQAAARHAELIARMKADAGATHDKLDGITYRQTRKQY